MMHTIRSLYAVLKMAYSDHVLKEIWEERYRWLRQMDHDSQHPLASYMVSPQGTFISYDVETAFCAGAWVSVIVLTHAAIDATIRDTEVGDYRSNSKVIFDNDPELEWLRKTRNSLVHVSEDGKSKFLPEGDMHNIADYHEALEKEAQRAIRLLFKVIYANPST
jgi:hypothetical protein